MNKPWLPYLVTDYIQQLHPRTIFEWGSGEGTRWLSKQGLFQLVSIEHNQEWYNNTKSVIPEWVDYQFIPFEDELLGNDPANPLHYKSGSTNLGDVNFKRYASIIDEYGLFDLILIDGMARASCLHHAFNHVAPGGCIVLDNTGDRPYYLEQTEAMFGNYEAGWEKVTMMGYGPILSYKWETTIFINRSKADYE